jgi:hypothetical protein
MGGGVKVQVRSYTLPRFAAFDKGGTPTVALVNQSTVPFSQWGCGPTPDAFVAAFQTYADLFAGYWNAPCKLRLASSEADVKPGEWEARFMNTAPGPGELADHDVSPSGTPRLNIYVQTTLSAGEAVSVSASHELVEALGNPSINAIRTSPRGTLVAQENADAVEAETFQLSGVSFSDFCFPSYFEDFRAAGSDQFDYLNKIGQPFEIAHGGYLPILIPGRGWTQKFGALEAEDCYCQLCNKTRDNIDAGVHGRRILAMNRILALAAPRSPHWPSVRREHLDRDPVCNVCSGTEHLNVHHVRPFHLFPELELEQSNLITLCERPPHNCHFLFGHLWSWAAWNPRVREDAAEWRNKVKHRKVA